MRHFTIFIATIYLTLCAISFSFAQVDSSYILETKIYAKYLDSINKLDHPQNFGFMTSIADGVIKTNDVVVGGFGVYTLSNAEGDTAFRIEYHENLDINTYKTYYFKFDKLIYATLEFKNSDTQASSFFKKEEFYKDDKVVLKNPQKDPSRYIDISAFSLFADGQKFLASFKKDNNRR